MVATHEDADLGAFEVIERLGFRLGGFTDGCADIAGIGSGGKSEAFLAFLRHEEVGENAVDPTLLRGGDDIVEAIGLEFDIGVDGLGKARGELNVMTDKMVVEHERKGHIDARGRDGQREIGIRRRGKFGRFIGSFLDPTTADIIKSAIRLDVR